MSIYKHILIAADGSENAIRAAKEAIKIASLNKLAMVEIVYVASFDRAKTDVLHAASAESLHLERRKKTEQIEQLMYNANVTYKVTMLHGNPGPEIVSYANEQKVDLVIIGSRGLNALQEMVLGSVSHKVMKRVNSPVMIVK